MSRSDSTLSRFLRKEAVSQQLMQLPRDHSGGVEWNTLGNIIVARTLGEVVCATYVDPVFGKECPGFEPDTDWRLSYKEKGVVVLRKRLQDSPIYSYMGRTVIDLPPREVHEVLGITESALHFDKYIVESRQVKNLRETKDRRDEICYMLYEGRQCLVKVVRDFLVYVRWEVLKEGKCVMSTLSIDHPDCPPVPGITRGLISPGSGWVLEPYKGDPNRTLVTNVVHVDLVGLPPLIINRVTRRQPLSTYYLKQYVLSKHKPIPRPLLTSTLSKTKSNEREHQIIDEVACQTNMPTSSEMPTPATNKRIQLDLTLSSPMESNPLYHSMMFRSHQSSVISVNSNKEIQTDHELYHSGNSRLVGIDSLVQRQVSIVPEEDENSEVIVNEVSSDLLSVQSELVSSEGFPMSLDLLKSSEARHKREVSNPQEKWVMVHDSHLSSTCDTNNSPVSPNPTVSSNIPKKRTVTPDITPVHSHGIEWSNATSNNE